MSFPPSQSRSRHAFTLIELLSVIAVLFLLLSLLRPVLSSLSKARQIDRASATVGGILENARISAVGSMTHIWIGFSELSDARLAIAIFTAKDGTPNFLPANLRLADRIIILDGVRLDNQLPGFGDRPLTKGGDNVYRVPSGGAGKTVSWSLPGGGNTTFRCLFEFTPEGTIVTDGQMRRLSELGLAHISDPEANNGRAIQLEGVTGRIHEYRP